MRPTAILILGLLAALLLGNWTLDSSSTDQNELKAQAHVPAPPAVDVTVPSEPGCYEQTARLADLQRRLAQLLDEVQKLKAEVDGLAGRSADCDCTVCQCDPCDCGPPAQKHVQQSTEPAAYCGPRGRSTGPRRRGLLRRLFGRR